METERSAGAVIFRTTPEVPTGIAAREAHAANLAAAGERLYLLLQYESGHWDYVKGNIEPGESELETVRRETREETGIKHLEFVPGFREEVSYMYTRTWGARKGGRVRVRKTVVFFLAATRDEKVTISHEHVGYAWMPYEGALKQLTFQNAQTILRKAEAFTAQGRVTGGR